ncbi:hypothetical protein BJX99DRAFT_250323 [Aspergillus californicus]
MLASLPEELLNIVISHITSRKDLKRICEVCTRVHDIAVPHLYRSLVLSAPELSLHGLVAKLHAIPSEYLKYTQGFGFSIPIHERVESRCPAGDELAESLENDGDIDYERDIDHESTDKVEVGTCIPEAFFCGHGSFLRNQGCIQSIILITDGRCDANNNAQDFVDLVQFRELRSLDWKGLSRYTDFESVRDCIQVHGHQIQSLTFDLVIWDLADSTWFDEFRHQIPRSTGTPDNFFSERVLNLHPGDRNVVFLSLEDLHLSVVSFDHAGMEMAHAFNIKHLKNLKLRNCPGSLSCLEKDGYMHIIETICDFIHYVSGLDSLYLMLPEPFDWTTLTERLSGHHHLKCLVMYHLVDRGGQSFIDGNIPWPLPLERILQGSQLTCFGSPIPPGELVSQFQKMQPRPSCKLIHIRISGVVLDRTIGSGSPCWSSESVYTYEYGDDLPYEPQEIYNFAEWAFSANGLPNLQVLACGDFSYTGRYEKFSHVLCKSGTGYQTLTPSEILSWNLVQDNMDMLAACPFDNILD